MRASLENKSMEPIQININKNNEKAVIKMSDGGKGVKNELVPFMFHYFFSTAPVSAPTYTYSGNFGVPFTGLGCGMFSLEVPLLKDIEGLPLSRLYAKFMGGDLRIESEENKGTEATVELNTSGNYELPVWIEQIK